MALSYFKRGTRFSQFNMGFKKGTPLKLPFEQFTQVMILFCLGGNVRALDCLHLILQIEDFVCACSPALVLNCSVLMFALYFLPLSIVLICNAIYFHLALFFVYTL